MPYDELLGDRVRRILFDKNVVFEEVRMMGGLCFMVDDKMCCGVMYNKKVELDLVMCRVGAEAQQENIERAGALPMDFTGRPMKNFLFVAPEGYDSDKSLEYWLQLCIDFNPFAKRSKKLKTKKK